MAKVAAVLAGCGVYDGVEFNEAVPEQSWQVYILECADGSLYTGVAVDLARRLKQHNGELAGGPKYTRGRRPVKLLWSDCAEDRSAAQRHESAIKKLSRFDKLRLSRTST